VRLTVDHCAQLLLVCCHLAAHADQVAARNIGYHRIVSGLFQDKQASATCCQCKCAADCATLTVYTWLKYQYHAHAVSPRPSVEIDSVGSSSTHPEVPMVRPASPRKDVFAAYDMVIMLGDLNYRMDLDTACAHD
jgi:hypothetical protein